jgi:hypothetical protein
MSKHDWKQINCSIFDDMLSTGRVEKTSTEDWPDWTSTVPGISNVYLTILDLTKKTDTGLLSTFDPNAKMIMGRYDQGTYKYYSYYFISMEDGRVFQSGPYTTDIPEGHHQVTQLDPSIL